MQYFFLLQQQQINHYRILCYNYLMLYLINISGITVPTASRQRGRAQGVATQDHPGLLLRTESVAEEAV